MNSSHHCSVIDALARPAAQAAVAALSVRASLPLHAVPAQMPAFRVALPACVSRSSSSLFICVRCGALATSAPLMKRFTSGVTKFADQLLRKSPGAELVKNALRSGALFINALQYAIASWLTAVWCDDRYAG